MLATAHARPAALVIGVDADRAAMAKASRTAARTVKRGGVPNALFVAAAAEALPMELNALASTITVHFPWGSLLRGLLTADPALLAGLRRASRVGATLAVLLSVTERDHVGGATTIDSSVSEHLGCSYAAYGFRLTEARPATAAEIAASHSTWAKRLGAGARRPAWLLRFSLAC